MQKFNLAESLARHGKRRALKDNAPVPPKSHPIVMFTLAG